MTGEAGREIPGGQAGAMQLQEAPGMEVDPRSGVLGEWSDCSAVSAPLPGSAADGSAGVIVISCQLGRGWPGIQDTPLAQYTQGRGPAITAGSGRSGWLGL